MDKSESKERIDALMKIMSGTDINNPIQRSELVELVTVPGQYDPDRFARQLIESARGNNYPIVNNGHGYFLAKNMEDANPWINEQTRKALKILKHVAEVKRAIRNPADNQITVYDFFEIVEEGCDSELNLSEPKRTPKKLEELRNYCMNNGYSMMEVGRAFRFGKYTSDADYNSVLKFLKSLDERKGVTA